ncbi:MAG: tRNA (adenosine(37)-N6)-threonylcarbamoyltransferase complex ATPase subunit type 1 TsaE [Solirubrobacterales bacterium]
MESIRTAGPRETEEAAARFAETLEAGDVVLLSGEVGAGKTVFVRGACQALGVTDAVTSPTYTIGQRYEADIPVGHVDLYRLAAMESEEPGLLDPYFGDDVICFVEWPKDAESGLERITARVELVHAGGDEREIHIER